MLSFSETKRQLFDYIQKNYPDVYSDFNDMSVGTMFIDLISYLDERSNSSMSAHLRETNIDDAATYHSLVNLAKKKGIKLKGKSASATLVELTVRLPVRGDAPDLSYAPVIVRGAQVTGAGQTFEILDDVDFSSPFTRNGTPNRSIQPIYNGNDVLAFYEVTKTEIAINGLSKFYTKEITINEAAPYYEIILPDENVLEVTDIITLNGVGLNRTPSLNDLYDDNNRWYEVDNLAQQEVFTYKTQVSTEGDL
jgi:hypothetical protein